jgi:hypothetical protein
MKQTMFQEKYPIYTLEVGKDECRFKSVDEIVDYLKEKIEEHPAACFIAEFDHYAHTQSLPKGEVAENIQAAKNVVFCFGIQLPNPQVMAVRPRSIGVVELAEHFVLTFLEAPVKAANDSMEAWARGVVAD